MTLIYMSNKLNLILILILILGLKRNSHPRKGNPGRHDEPKPEVANLDLEEAGQGTDPDLQAEPGLEPEPDLTKAGLDLGNDLLSPENAPGKPTTHSDGGPAGPENKTSYSPERPSKRSFPYARSGGKGESLKIPLLLLSHH